jgi:hypothetical protein
MGNGLLGECLAVAEDDLRVVAICHRQRHTRAGVRATARRSYGRWTSSRLKV